MVSEETLKRLREARLPRAKNTKPIASVSLKKQQKNKEAAVADSDSSLDKWFDTKMKESDPECMECGMRADWLKEPKYESLWRACQAHILPKKKSMFPTLASNPFNHLVLFPSYGGYLCGCHGEFDVSWESASRMKIFPRAKEIFHHYLFKEVPPDRIRLIPKQLL